MDLRSPLLAASLLPLLAGPLLARWADRYGALRAAMDAFVLIALGGIVMLHVWPHAYQAAGWLALIAGAAGITLPFAFHQHRQHRHGRQPAAGEPDHACQDHDHRREAWALPTLLILGVAGLAVHAMVDGVAIAGSTASTGAAHAAGQGAGMLALAVVLHRLPMALAIWWLARPILGRKAAIMLLAAIGGATLVGYASGSRLLSGMSGPGQGMFDAAVAGMLLHIVFGHRHSHGPSEPARYRSPAWLLGGALGVLLLVGLAWADQG